MRRIITFILAVIMGVAFIAPPIKAETSFEPENSYCVYGVSGMSFTLRAKRAGGLEVARFQIDYEFPNDSSHYSNPYVISNSVLSDMYNANITSVTLECPNASAITLTSTDAIISGTDTITISDETPLALLTRLLSLKRMYLFPIGTAPEVAGVTPTPFVNDGDDIVVNDGDLNDTIGAVSSFSPFIQFLFGDVIPWAGFASVIILVFATLKFMLKG